MVGRSYLVFGWAGLVLVTPSLQACAERSGLTHIKPKACKHPFGPVVLKKDGTIVIHYRRLPKYGIPASIFIIRSDQNGYRDAAETYGGQVPGKPMVYCRPDHSVHMNADGTLWVRDAGIPLEVGGHAPDAPIKPDNPLTSLY